mgnify:CR=1 FL=1
MTNHLDTLRAAHVDDARAERQRLAERATAALRDLAELAALERDPDWLDQDGKIRWQGDVAVIPTRELGTGAGVAVYGPTGSTVYTTSAQLTSGNMRVRDGFLTFQDVYGWHLISMATGRAVAEFTPRANIGLVVPFMVGTVLWLLEYDNSTGQFSLRPALGEPLLHERDRQALGDLDRRRDPGAHAAGAGHRERRRRDHGDVAGARHRARAREAAGHDDTLRSHRARRHGLRDQRLPRPHRQ